MIDAARAFRSDRKVAHHVKYMTATDCKTVHPGDNRLPDRLLAVEEYSERYDALLKELAATVFTQERLTREFDQEVPGLETGAAGWRVFRADRRPGIRRPGKSLPSMV